MTVAGKEEEYLNIHGLFKPLAVFAATHDMYIKKKIKILIAYIFECIFNVMKNSKNSSPQRQAPTLYAWRSIWA